MVIMVGNVELEGVYVGFMYVKLQKEIRGMSKCNCYCHDQIINQICNWCVFQQCSEYEPIFITIETNTQVTKEVNSNQPN
jgi:hypothetical protein